MHRSRDRRRGFTLLELMIVVVIVGIVSMLGLPAMQDTVSEGRLYSSARSVADLLTFARMQSIMRNQAHEVTVVISPGRPGGRVEVRRFQGAACANVLPQVIRSSETDQEIVGITGLQGDTPDAGNSWHLCFRPNGRAYKDGLPLVGEPHVELRRFSLKEAGPESVAWPLFVRVGHMGVALLAKLPPDARALAQGEGNDQ